MSLEKGIVDDGDPDQSNRLPANPPRTSRWGRNLTKLADIAAAGVQNYAASLGKGFTFEQHKDIEYIIGKVLTDCVPSLLPVQPQNEYTKGVRDAAEVAHKWATSPSCTSHDDNPCCHVRTGAGIRDAINDLLPIQPAASTPTDVVSKSVIKRLAAQRGDDAASTEAQDERDVEIDALKYALREAAIFAHTGWSHPTNWTDCDYPVCVDRKKLIGDYDG